MQKYGRNNENTPAKWNAEYTDYNAPAGDGTTSAPTGETTIKSDVLAAPAVAPTGEDGDTSMALDPSPPASSDAAEPPTTNGESTLKIKKEEKEKKRKNKHEGETAEEKAERKKRKQEKKEKKEKKGKKGKKVNVKKEEDSEDSD